jgi:acyl-CoA reductase-like NAD-dependent aldehyde dehydrogenase
MDVSENIRHEAMRIGGEKITTKDRIEVLNPYNGSVVGTIPRGTREHVKKAFKIAANYQPTLTRYERQQILIKTAEIIISRKDEISDLITAELGISKKDSLSMYSR